MNTEEFLDILNKYETEYIENFTTKQFENTLIAMSKEKTFIIYLDDITLDQNPRVLLNYDLSPNSVKILLFRLLIFMDSKKISFNFEDHFYIRKSDGMILKGNRAALEWEKDKKDYWYNEFNEEKHIDELFLSYSDDECILC